jgi:carbon storage regulator
MLVLSRKVGERIHIGNDVVVTVLSVRGGRVRLGIEAPEGIHIKRHELIFEEAQTREHEAIAGV